MDKLIYLDNAATTPVDPRVAEVMLNYLTADGKFGNPSSLTHDYGLVARMAVEMAREKTAELINAEPAALVWTSGATEAVNLALKGAAELYQDKGKHIITVKTEHKAVLDTCQYLEKKGFKVTYLTPEKNGLLDLQKLKDAIRPDTIMIAVMYVNNETGVIQDIEAIAKIAEEQDILFMVDAAQAAGKISIDVKKTPIDLMAVCAHKVYGPKGIGALYVRRKPRVKVAPLIHGGGHEHGMRSGTLATHQIIGMAFAFDYANSEMDQYNQKIHALRETFLKLLSEKIDFKINGENCYPGIVNIYFPQGVPALKILAGCNDIAASPGSACLANGVEPSYVLRAMGLSRDDAKQCLRFSFGRFNTLAEIEKAADCLTTFLKKF